MSLHTHHHRNCRDVAEDEDEEHPELEEVFDAAVVRMDANGEMKKFLSEKPKEGIHVMGLFGARNDTKPEDVLQFEADIGGQVVVEYNEGPGCLCTSSEWSETVCGEAEGNVSWVFEESMWKLPSIDEDVLLTKVLKVVQVVDVFHHTGLVVEVFCTVFCHEQALGATYIVPARCEAKLDIASFWRSWFSGWSVPNIMSSFQQLRVRLPFWQIFVSDLS